MRVVGRRVHSKRAARVLGVLFDITAEQEARDIREMMLREMNHRVKNMFSVISSMVRMAGRSSDNIDDLVEGIQARINALARSHDMTQRSRSGKRLRLEDAIRAALEPYGGQAEFGISGPGVILSSQELTSLSLLLHEWATNAAKYGVLGPASGRLDVAWKTQNDGSVELTWNEIHDQRVVPDDNGSGFGSTLVELAAAQLGGSVTVSFNDNERKMILVYVPENNE